MRTIYKTNQGEKIVKDLYDRQVESLDVEYKDIFVDTRFGKTHILQIGNPDATPILLFHGGNSTAPYSLKQNLHLVEDYLIYAPDTIGHPGKSSQRVLSSSSLEYGEWASDVIDSLGFDKMICMGESFGGGILAKLICVSPEKVAKAILLVPAGIFNASKAKLIFSMGIPMMMYLVTKKETWFDKAFLPMATNDEPIDTETLDMIRTSFHHVKINPNMPSNIDKKDVMNYQAPTLVLAGEEDVMFPGEKVIERAEELFPDVKSYLIKECGHIYFTSEKRKEIIGQIINEFLLE
ncbi:MAG: alpha/beta hydrolase [Alkalibacterium sp.]|nr:alpha/beta hydrolase [Alkalibacterium sp.]TVP92053.1 MAG: alpha/beta hydrolase [Alkalibacterium sp.]